jgi:hypothetical protein
VYAVEVAHDTAQPCVFLRAALDNWHQSFHAHENEKKERRLG